MFMLAPAFPEETVIQACVKSGISGELLIDSKFNPPAIAPRRAGVPGAGAKAVAAGA